MKKNVILLSLILILGGCVKTKNIATKEYTERYENYMEMLIDNAQQVSTDLPFEWEFQMVESNGTYTYEVKISRPRVAMSNVQMIAVNINEISESSVAPSIGIFEDNAYHMYPNQINPEKGFYSGIGVNGISQTSSFDLNCLVVYKDKNLNDNYVYFIIHADAQDMQATEEAVSDE